MDQTLWRSLLQAIQRAARQIGWHGGRRQPRYPNWLIVALYLWSVWHDRPLSWACQRGSYGNLFRPRHLPSISQFTRRIRSPDCQQILLAVHQQFDQHQLPTDMAYLDGKPLLVSPVSKDRDAKRGKISGGYARGYKLHALVNEQRRIVLWSVMGLNEDEKTVARQLLPRLGCLTPEAVVLEDSQYDSSPLHQELAEPLGICLVHPLRGQQRAGGAYRWRKLQEMSVSRRALLGVWQEQPGLVRWVLKSRLEIERVFGGLVCTAGLLASLPAWVRGLERVRRWVGAKIVLYNARLAVQERLQMEAVA